MGAPKPTCASPCLYRTSCSNFAIVSGGMQLGSSRREFRTRGGGEGARQEDSGRRRFGLHGVPTTALGRSIGG